MQKMKAVEKPKDNSLDKNINKAQNKLAMKTPIKHKADPLEIIQRIRLKPETLSREDMVVLQNTIGNRAVIKLLIQIKKKHEAQKAQSQQNTGKQNVAGEKAEQPNEMTANDAVTPTGQSKSESKAQEVIQESSEVVEASDKKNTDTDKVEKTKDAPAEAKEASPQDKQALPAKEKEADNNTPAADKKAKKDNNTPQVNKVEKTPDDMGGNYEAVEAEQKKAPKAKEEKEETKSIQKEDSQEKENKITKDGKSSNQQDNKETWSNSFKEITSTLSEKKSKEPSKEQAVKIKGEDPAQILEQLGNVPPTAISDAYSQAAALSRGALEKQRENTQKIIPQISAPTGLQAKKMTGKAGKKLNPIKHAAINGFKSQKSSGKLYEGMLSEFKTNTNGEPDPDTIMAEARALSTQSPKISMDGEADPSQITGFKTESDQNVKAAKQAELGLVNSDFGENNIYPQETTTMLKSQKGIQAVTSPSVQVPKTTPISNDIAVHLNKSLSPGLNKQMTEKRNEYQKGKEKFDTDVIATKADTDSQIEQQKLETREKQLAEQASTKSEVDKLRGEWRTEINNSVAEYDQLANKASESKKSEIGNIKTQKESEVKKELVNAEKDAQNETKKAKKDADKKRQDGEKEKEKGGFWSWVKEKAKKFLDGIKNAINAIYNVLRKAVKIIFDKAKQVVKTIIEAGRKLIVNIIKELGKFLKELVKVVFAKFPKIAQKICSKIDEKVNNAIKFVNTAADMLQKGITKVLDFLASTLDGLFGAIQSLYNSIFTIIGDIITGNYADIMERIGALGQAAKESLSHIEGAIWEQLIGVDLSKPMGQAENEDIAETETINNESTGENEKLTEDDIAVDPIMSGQMDPEFIESLNLRDGEVREIQGSNNPYTIDTIANEFDVDKANKKTDMNIVDEVKMRAENGAKVLDQIKQFVIKWLKDNWAKILLGVIGALAGIVVLEIITGGAITAALPTIISAIVNIMNASAVVSIVDTITKAAVYVEKYLTQGWAKNIPVAAVSLATALAMGLVELAMELIFRGVGKGLEKAGAGLKSAKSSVKTKMKAAATRTKEGIKKAAKSIKKLLKSGTKLVSRSGSMIIQNGKLIIKSLQKGLIKGVKKLDNLIAKLLQRFRFKKFKLERKGKRLQIHGEINPWILLYDGTVEWVEKEDLGVPKTKPVKVGEMYEYKGNIAEVVDTRREPSKNVTKLINEGKGIGKSTKGAAEANGLKQYPDGSIRDSKGRFAGKTGTVPGTPGVDKAMDIIKNDATYKGYDILGTEISVRGADGTLRRYDIVARKPDGSIVGIEVKSGTATRTAQQKLIDNELLQNGGLNTVGDKARSIGVDRIDTFKEIKVK